MTCLSMPPSAPQFQYVLDMCHIKCVRTMLCPIPRNPSNAPTVLWVRLYLSLRIAPAERHQKYDQATASRRLQQ
jgi:hypothetical protein